MKKPIVLSLILISLFNLSFAQQIENPSYFYLSDSSKVKNVIKKIKTMEIKHQADRLAFLNPTGKNGFSERIGISAGLQSILAFGMIGPSVKVFIPLPMGLRLTAEYANFGGEKYLEDNTLYSHIEFHVSSDIQAKIFNTKKLDIYNSIGVNYGFCYDAVVKENIATDEVKDHSSNEIHSGEGLLDLAAGLGSTYDIHKNFSILNEWSINTMGDFKGTIGIKYNIL